MESTMVENKKKLKLINGDDSVILTIDYTNLSVDILRNMIPTKIGIVTTNGCNLRFVENENRKSGLEMEDVYILCGLFQSVFGNNIVWDIIDKTISEEDPEDLNGYLYLE